MKSPLHSSLLLLVVALFTSAAAGLYALQLGLLYSAPHRSERTGSFANSPSPSQTPCSSCDAEEARSLPPVDASNREELLRQLSEERSRYYLPGEMNKYLFGQMVLTAISRFELQIEGVQDERLSARSSVHAPPHAVEVHLSGGPEEFLRFLRSLDQREKLWTTKTCDLRVQGTRVSASLVIGYREYVEPRR